MMKRMCYVKAGLIGLLFWLNPAVAEQPKPDAEKFTLRYQFHPGETLRWNVVHRTVLRTTISDVTQTAETTSISVKVWRVSEVKPDGSATFVHLVEDVDMRQQSTGRGEVRYNSRTDKAPPPGFENFAQAVGVPLAVVTLDPQGKVLKRQRKPVKAAAPNEGEITIPLPDKPVEVGYSWSFPHDISVPQKNGLSVKLKTVQRFTLVGVKTGVATIAVATHILTPLQDPAIESQVIDRESNGTVRFDLDAGRVLSQEMDLDKHVVGFRGEASSLHYVTRATEELLPAEARIAAKPERAKVSENR